MNPPVLVVDLDGSLVLTDMLHESALKLFKQRPWDVLRIPFWLAEGKAALKQRLASGAEFDPVTLPYNLPLLDWLRAQRTEGRRLVLCTASDTRIAESIAQHLGIFDEVIASDGTHNLAGPDKAKVLCQRFGERGFDYVGNSSADLAVWPLARRAIVVNAPARLVQRARALAEVEREFAAPARDLRTWGSLLRVHQWLKNLLLMVPLLAAHDLANGQAWGALALGFAAFCLCASSVYMLNDLLDLESDRRHPRKRMRPFASGQIPVSTGVLMMPVLLMAGMGIGFAVGPVFLSCLVLYFVLTCAYSWVLKRLMLVDCLTLAVLYTLRIIAGAAAVGHALSFWLLAFSVFLFLSLAFVKRYAELEIQQATGDGKIHGRGYRTADAPLVQTMGIIAGYTSVLVLALYLNSETVIRLYRSPTWIWGAVPVVLFWISWMWMQAHRGRMHDDPLVFAVKDRASLIAGALFVAILIIGAVGGRLW